MTLDVVQYPGVALGLIGAILVSQRSAHRRRWGFLLWIGSNVLLISWAVGAAAWGLLAMYAVYSVTSIMGWWNNRDSGSSDALSNAKEAAHDQAFAQGHRVGYEEGREAGTIEAGRQAEANAARRV